MAEAALVACTTASVAFLMIYGLDDCRKIDPDPETGGGDHYPIQVSMLLKFIPQTGYSCLMMDKLSKW